MSPLFACGLRQPAAAFRPQCLEQLKTPVTYFCQHHRRAAAVGAFDWPVPSEVLNAFERFHKESRSWPRSIPVAFPRFVDIYAEAKVSASYGRLDDDKGQSFRMMLERGLWSNAPIVQLATWNDWGEGTQIEPSVEFGYRDLETVQARRRKHVDPKFAISPVTYGCRSVCWKLDASRMRIASSSTRLPHRSSAEM